MALAPLGGMAAPVSIVSGSPVSEASARGSHPRVLVVDDDAEMRALLRRTLEFDGYLVTERDRGAHVLGALREAPFDLIILDKEMPEMTGLDVLPLLRREFPGVPVLLVTAFGGGQVESSALRLGATSYLEKPFRLSQLRDVVDGLLGGPPSESTVN
jgi:two-component system response regulator FlrC